MRMWRCCCVNTWKRCEPWHATNLLLSSPQWNQGWPPGPPVRGRLSRRSAAALAISVKICTNSGELSRTATPHAFVTPFLILVCVVVYAVMVYSGVSPLWPTGSQLILWGANEGARVILLHEYWRLFTSVFVHGGFIHVALNMWSLLAIGPLVERLYGNVAFAVIYLAAGIGGALSSIAANPVRASVGASARFAECWGHLWHFCSCIVARSRRLS